MAAEKQATCDVMNRRTTTQLLTQRTPWLDAVSSNLFWYGRRTPGETRTRGGVEGANRLLAHSLGIYWVVVPRPRAPPYSS